MTIAAPADGLIEGAAMPWPLAAPGAVPFHMRPHLERLASGEDGLLLADDQAAFYRRERARLLAAAPERVQVGAPHAGVLAAIAALQARTLPSLQIASGERRDAPGEERSPAAAELEGACDARSVALGMQEDFVILRRDADALRTEFLSVAFPSRWDPREKLERDFAAIHAPVADNTPLLAAAPAFMRLAFEREPMLRHVWLIVPSPALDQHPEANLAWWQAALADPAPLLPRLFFRVERQTTWPLPALDRAVFFIRVLMASLPKVLAVEPGRSARLRAALTSMTPAVVAYRGMTEALPRLLAELDEAVA